MARTPQRKKKATKEKHQTGQMMNTEGEVLEKIDFENHKTMYTREETAINPSTYEYVDLTAHASEVMLSEKKIKDMFSTYITKELASLDMRDGNAASISSYDAAKSLIGIGIGVGEEPEGVTEVGWIGSDGSDGNIEGHREYLLNSRIKKKNKLENKYCDPTSEVCLHTNPINELPLRTKSKPIKTEYNNPPNIKYINENTTMGVRKKANPDLRDLRPGEPRKNRRVMAIGYYEDISTDIVAENGKIEEMVITNNYINYTHSVCPGEAFIISDVELSQEQMEQKVPGLNNFHYVMCSFEQEKDDLLSITVSLSKMGQDTLDRWYDNYLVELADCLGIETKSITESLTKHMYINNEKLSALIYSYKIPIMINLSETGYAREAASNISAVINYITGFCLDRYGPDCYMSFRKTHNKVGNNKLVVSKDFMVKKRNLKGKSFKVVSYMVDDGGKKYVVADFKEDINGFCLDGKVDKRSCAIIPETVVVTEEEYLGKKADEVKISN